MAGFIENAAAERAVYPQRDSGNSQRLDMTPKEELTKRMEWSLFIPRNPKVVAFCVNIDNNVVDYNLKSEEIETFAIHDKGIFHGRQRFFSVTNNTSTPISSIDFDSFDSTFPQWSVRPSAFFINSFLH